MFKFIENWFNPKNRIEYPDEFAFIKFSDIAFESGAQGDSNKIIERYSYDTMGNLKVKMYRYSKERAFAFRETLGIPVFDKTEQELTFPIAGKIELGVVKFKTK